MAEVGKRCGGHCMRKVSATGHCRAGIAGDTTVARGFQYHKSTAGGRSRDFHWDTPAQKGLSDGRLINGTVPFRELLPCCWHTGFICTPETLTFCLCVPHLTPAQHHTCRPAGVHTFHFAHWERKAVHNTCLHSSVNFKARARR